MRIYVVCRRSTYHCEVLGAFNDERFAEGFAERHAGAFVKSTELTKIPQRQGGGLSIRRSRQFRNAPQLAPRRET